MRFPGLKRARQVGRWLRSRYDKAALILGYHRITDAPHDTFDICVTPQRFSEQLAVLNQLATPVSLATLIGGLAQGVLPERAVVVTFDDGYVDFQHQALPVLEQQGISATLYVTAGYLGRTYWWDRLAVCHWRK